jgi:hypothetical protein
MALRVGLPSSTEQKIEKFSQSAYQKDYNMFVVADIFLSYIINEYGKYIVTIEGNIRYPPQACKSKLNHYIKAS